MTPKNKQSLTKKYMEYTKITEPKNLSPQPTPHSTQ